MQTNKFYIDVVLNSKTYNSETDTYDTTFKGEVIKCKGGTFIFYIDTLKDLISILDENTIRSIYINRTNGN